ncbi:MAG TPA: hypothetical protein VKA73_14130 [Rubrobacter sp.]|nr:hypothetical protein [Rubrobacter sp.]
MDRFLEDLPVDLEEGRYVDDALPHLRFGDDDFDLALCSHLLFLYSDALSLDFHVAAVREMCRVAGEARVFPLLGARCGEVSPHLAPAIQHLGELGYGVERRRVHYEFLRGANEMLTATGPWPRHGASSESRA